MLPATKRKAKEDVYRQHRQQLRRSQSIHVAETLLTARSVVSTSPRHQVHQLSLRAGCNSNVSSVYVYRRHYVTVTLYRCVDVIITRRAGDTAPWLVVGSGDVTVRSWRDDSSTHATANNALWTRADVVDVRTRWRWRCDVWSDVTVGARCTWIVITGKLASTDVISDVISVGSLGAAVGSWFFI